jgi:hypothetical protein
MNANSGHLSCIGVGLALLPIRDQSWLDLIGLVALDWKKVEHFTYGFEAWRECDHDVRIIFSFCTFAPHLLDISQS